MILRCLFLDDSAGRTAAVEGEMHFSSRRSLAANPSLARNSRPFTSGVRK